MTRTLDDIASRIAPPPPTGAAVLIPLLPHPDGIDVLLEMRSLTLDIQPGEVCLPGGHIEPGETAEQAAVRETSEELLIDPMSIHIIGTLGNLGGPGGMPVWVFVGTIDDYAGTFSPEEVDHTFAISLDWLIAHDPALYHIPYRPDFSADFPWDLVPGGRAYDWRAQIHDVAFYLGTDPFIWGFTARVLHRFALMLRD